MQRPSSITTFGILNLAFAAAGIGGILSTLRMFSADSSATANPVIELLLRNPVYASWMELSIIPGAVACIVLLAAGVGLLKFREWGRKLSIGYAVYGIVSCITGMVVNLLYLIPPTLQEASQKQGPESTVMVVVAFGVTLTSVISLIYPIILLVFMMRPWMKAAFRPAVPPPLPR